MAIAVEHLPKAEFRLNGALSAFPSRPGLGGWRWGRGRSSVRSVS